MTTRGNEKGRAVPSGREIDRLNEIANGLAAASLALDVGARETAKKVVYETLTRASAYLSEAVVEARIRDRRQRRARWGAGSATAAAVAAGLALVAPVSPGLPGQAGGTTPEAAQTPDATPIREIVASGPGGADVPSTLDASKRDREASIIFVDAPSPSGQQTPAEPPPPAQPPQVPDADTPEAPAPELVLEPEPEREPEAELDPEPAHPSDVRSEKANPPDDAGPPDKADKSNEHAERRQNA
jgi:outer membrane biosynthesis protein TonB